MVQNHFASVAPVKPGWFRWIVLKTVLKLIHVLAAVVSNQGSLSGITSIHFARWVVVDGGKKLLFLSNYDGSWENYLDDFIDQTSEGLTAIWSNTVGFPQTSFPGLWGSTQRDPVQDHDPAEPGPVARLVQRLSRLERAEHPQQCGHPRRTLRRDDASGSPNLAAKLLIPEAEMATTQIEAQPQTKTQPQTVEWDDVQGLVLRGYGKHRFSANLLLASR